MASQQDVLSCLPTEFLAEEDSPFMDKDSSFITTEFNTAESKLSSCFPTEFPYEFDSFGYTSSLSSPEESVLGSYETESTERDEFFAGLTRRLSQQLAVKPEMWVMAGSPESTLSGLGSWSASSNGSPNGVLSPPMTPFGAKTDAWDLIHEAAGEIARLKLNSEANKLSSFQDAEFKFQDMSFMGSTRTQNSVGQLRGYSSGFFSTRSLGQDIPPRRQCQHQIWQEQVPKRQCSSVWGRQEVKMGMHAQSQPYLHLQNQQHLMPSKGKSLGSANGSCVRPMGVSHSAWHGPRMQQAGQNLQHSSSGMRAVFLGGSGVKRECAGTGVFLPRRYGNVNHPSEPKKKTVCPSVLLPAKVVHALNLNFDDMKSNSQPQPSLNSGFVSDYDMLMARRSAILAQQKRNSHPQNVLNHEIRLPREWTY